MDYKETEVGRIPTYWNVYQLSDIGEIVGGGTPKTKVDEYWNGDIPWITPKDLSGFTDRYIYSGERNITKIGLDKSSAKLLPKNTVLFSSRAPIGYVAIAGNELTTNQGFKSIICNENNAYPLFIYYLLKSKKESIENIAGGSTFKEISGKAMKEFKVQVPPISEQRAIAKILSALDEKIETNNRINEKLEEMAQALFKHWFVNFEFPNENGEPYKSSGGEMVESELGLIPKGWKIVNLDELTTKFTTGLNPRKNFVLGHGNNYYVTIKNMGNQQIYLDDKCDKIDDEALKVINKRSDLKKGDLLFSGIGTIGRVYLIDETPTSWNISESIFTLRPSDYISSELLYLILLSEELQGYAQQLASGSVQRGVRMRDLKAYKLSLPRKCLTDKFTSLVSPLIKQQKNLVKENVRLTNIRETLLPKLLSGEIRIPLNDE